jgi:hypothetical protein
LHKDAEEEVADLTDITTKYAGTKTAEFDKILEEDENTMGS